MTDQCNVMYVTRWESRSPLLANLTRADCCRLNVYTPIKECKASGINYA